MTRTTRLAAVVMAIALAACGTSGSNPPQLSEVHFFVQALPHRTSQFQVADLSGGGVRFTSLDNSQFLVFGTIDFVIENAAPDLMGTFLRTSDSGDEITVSLSQIGTTGNQKPTRIGSTSGPQDSVTLSTANPGTPGSTLPAASPDVRVDVCVPTAGKSSCLVVGDPQTPIDPGDAGIQFSGSIGDGVSTRLVGSPNETGFALTPSLYFYAGARDNVNAVFRSISGQNLIVRLYVNGALRKTSSGTKDVVIREDL